MRRITFVAIASALLVASACGNEEPVERAAPTGTAESTEDATSAAGGTSMSAGSCVEQYSLETLKRRDYAFDGTIKSIEPDPADGPDTVVFEVRTWFKGGEGDTAAKQAFGSGGGMTSAGGSSHTVGERLLVAGDEDFVWECGFTQPYDDAVAEDWDTAL